METRQKWVVVGPDEEVLCRGAEGVLWCVGVLWAVQGCVGVVGVALGLEGRVVGVVVHTGVSCHTHTHTQVPYGWHTRRGGTGTGKGTPPHTHGQVNTVCLAKPAAACTPLHVLLVSAPCRVLPQSRVSAQCWCRGNFFKHLKRCCTAVLPASVGVHQTALWAPIGFWGSPHLKVEKTLLN